MEDLRLVPGHLDYAVTPDGTIWSRKRGEWRALALSLNGRKGYLKVKLTGSRTYRVHTLVALAYLGPRPAGLVINHMDGDKRNNAAGNLEYCTYSENAVHAHRLGLVPPRFTHASSPPRPPRAARASKSASRTQSSIRKGGGSNRSQAQRPGSPLHTGRQAGRCEPKATRQALRREQHSGIEDRAQGEVGARCMTRVHRARRCLYAEAGARITLALLAHRAHPAAA